jgi:hypothetical protein
MTSTLDRQPVEPPKDLPAGLKVWNCWLQNKHYTRPRKLSLWYQWPEMDLPRVMDFTLDGEDTIATMWEAVISGLEHERKDDA